MGTLGIMGEMAATSLNLVSCCSACYIAFVDLCGELFSDYKANSENNPLNIAATRLASLERGIERRYFKQPLRNE